MSEEPTPSLHPDLEAARYGRNHAGDHFVGFWLELMIEARHGRLRPVAVRTRRLLDRFWAQPAVSTALATVGDSAFNDQLSDAAAIYFTSCLTDPQYSSTMWRMNRIEPEKLRNKMATETANTLALLADSGGLVGPGARLPDLLTDGFLKALAPNGATELAEAVAQNPAAMRAMELSQE